MLQIVLPKIEGWDEGKEEFVALVKEQTLTLEHSLVSISKWESKWNKPFLSKEEKTFEEIINYIKCMTLTQNVNQDVYNRLTSEHFRAIDDYIDAPMTATWFADDKKEKGKGKHNKRTITSELIYYWMIALNIPMECQKWHFNRLITLIRVCNEENKPPKKLGRNELLNRNRALNAARKKRLNTKG